MQRGGGAAIVVTDADNQQRTYLQEIKTENSLFWRTHRLFDQGIELRRQRWA
jgi:hypothetical protein